MYVIAASAIRRTGGMTRMLERDWWIRETYDVDGELVDRVDVRQASLF